MQALARVNRTFRNKQDGLLVATRRSRRTSSRRRGVHHRDRTPGPWARTSTTRWPRSDADRDQRRGPVWLDWRARRAAAVTRAYWNAVTGAIDYLRRPGRPGQPVDGDEPGLSERFRRAAAQLARMYAICRAATRWRDSVTTSLLRAGPDAERQIRRRGAQSARRGRPARYRALPELSHRERHRGRAVTDIYAAAGIGAPTCPDWTRVIARMRAQRNPIWPSRPCAAWSRRCALLTRHNVVKQIVLRRAPRRPDARPPNQNLTAAQIITELVALAREVSADASRGTTFAPPLNGDELAFYDAVAQNESAVTEMGDGKLAEFARDLVRTPAATSPRTGQPDDVRAKIPPPSSASWPSRLSARCRKGGDPARPQAR